MLIETNGVRFLTDPGAYSTTQNEVTGIDAILITHEHHDHVHIDSLLAILKHNPHAKVITNQSVGTVLADKGISYQIVADSEQVVIKGVLIKGFGTKHAVIYGTFGQVENTGYKIGDNFFYPGDALNPIAETVPVLALPVAGPWLKISEAIDFAIAQHPTVCFSVHDGMFKSKTFVPGAVEKILEQHQIKFLPLGEGEHFEY